MKPDVVPWEQWHETDVELRRTRRQLRDAQEKATNYDQWFEKGRCPACHFEERHMASCPMGVLEGEVAALAQGINWLASLSGVEECADCGGITEFVTRKLPHKGIAPCPRSELRRPVIIERLLADLPAASRAILAAANNAEQWRGWMAQFGRLLVKYRIVRVPEDIEAKFAAAEREQGLREAMPDPDKLEMLADWFDVDDAEKGRRHSSLATLGGQPPDEVQRELRRWASNARATLAQEGAAVGD